MADRRGYEEFWPIGVSDVSGDELRALDDRQFSRLKRLVLERELRLTGSRGRAKAIARQFELKRRTEKRTEFTRAAFLAQFKESELLDAFVPDRAKRWRSFARRKRGVTIEAQEFSFLDN